MLYNKPHYKITIIPKEVIFCQHAESIIQKWALKHWIYYQPEKGKCEIYSNGITTVLMLQVKF